MQLDMRCVSYAIYCELGLRVSVVEHECIKPNRFGKIKRLEKRSTCCVFIQNGRSNYNSGKQELCQPKVNHLSILDCN